MSGSNDASEAPQTGIKTIVEGTATMCYPADQESTVFYNPVQVQNRDLSILMISLYSERRAAKMALAKRKKKLREEQKDQDQKTWKQDLEEYSQKLTAKEALAELDTREEGLSILEALAASGLRSIRYWKEIPAVRHVTINDMELAAVERAHTNIELNKLQDVLVNQDSGMSNGTPSQPLVKRPYGIRINHGDAIHEMYNSRRIPNRILDPEDLISARTQPQWDVIDLDPYGSAAPFIDGAVQAVASGGLLCVTCTDMAALGGSHPETAFGRYAAMPIQRAGYLHEMALRILLQTISTSAARYGRTIRPILSVGMDFYVRVFVEVNDDKRGVMSLSLQTGLVYQSTRCPSFEVAPNGMLGGKKKNVYKSGRLPKEVVTDTIVSEGAYKVAGPIWLGPLHDKEVIGEALKKLKSKADENGHPNMETIATQERLRGLLSMCAEELDAPLYYRLPDLSKAVHLSSPPMLDMKSAIINAGYQVSGFHKEPQAIKTDAPSAVIWDILRAWAKKHPSSKTPDEDSAAHKILSAESTIEVDFSKPKSLPTRQDGVARFPANPQANWGPKSRASGHKRKAEDDPKKDLA